MYDFSLLLPFTQGINWPPFRGKVRCQFHYSYWFSELPLTESGHYPSDPPTVPFRFSLVYIKPDFSDVVHWICSLLLTSFLLGLYIDPESGTNMFFRNTSFLQTTQNCNPEEHMLHNTIFHQNVFNRSALLCAYIQMDRHGKVNRHSHISAKCV